MRQYYISITIISIITLATLVGIFMIWESPAEARKRKLDESYTSALYDLKNYIDMYVSEHNVLPKSINDTKYQLSKSTQAVLLDANIKYNVISAKKYELCATFNNEYTMNPSVSTYDQNMSVHTAGKNCYTFTAPINVNEETKINRNNEDFKILPPEPVTVY